MTTKNTNARKPNGKKAALKAAEDALTPEQIADREARQKAFDEQEKINEKAAKAQEAQEKKEAKKAAEKQKAYDDKMKARAAEPNCMVIKMQVTGNDGETAKYETTLANLRACMMPSKMNDTDQVDKILKDALVKEFGIANVK